MYKVFIDGQEGTTGLRIIERFKNRNDIEILKIDEALRKDPNERQKFINQSDITFLCLPDQASIEACDLVTNPNVRIIDAATVHRTMDGWVYGFPELDKDFYTKLKTAKRVAVPGCYASGFLSIVYPLEKEGILSKDSLVTSYGLSGYSGAGKKAIALYNNPNRDKSLDSPRAYSLGQAHKHIKEMQFIAGLNNKPIFNPIVCDYYAGMLVFVPIFLNTLSKKITAKELRDKLANYYKNQEFVRVMDFIETGTEDGYMPSNSLEGRDYMNIYVCGNDERVTIISQLDNLGKGASGAAIECMNIMLGLDPKTGLDL